MSGASIMNYLIRYFKYDSIDITKPIDTEYYKNLKKPDELNQDVPTVPFAIIVVCSHSSHSRTAIEVYYDKLDFKYGQGKSCKKPKLTLTTGYSFQRRWPSQCGGPRS